MKKIIAILLSALMILTMFASCSKETGIIDDGERDNQPAEQIKVESVEELMDKMTAVETNLDSFDADLDIVFDVTLMGEKTVIDVDMAMEMILSEGLYHVAMNTEAMDEKVSIEMYSDMNNSYISEDGVNWYKESMGGLNVDEYKKMLDKAKDLDIDYSKYITNAEFVEEEYNGKKCYKLSGDVVLKLFELLEDAGLSEEMDKAFAAAGIGENELLLVKELLGDLGTVSAVEYVDAYTLYPVYAEMDMTQAMKVIFDKVIAITAQMYGEEIDVSSIASLISINSVTAKMNVNNVNDVTITIPEEVLDAPDIDDIVIEDEYFEEELYDEEYYDDFYEEIA